MTSGATVIDVRLPFLLLFTSFVVTFLATRIITRMIRAGVGPFRNNVRDGVHVHHSVPGIILLIIGAFMAVGAQSTFWSCVAAVLIGIGTSLVLDEFALILHLQDVYWTDEGRTSVEMVSLAAACLGFVLVGIVPFDDSDFNGSGGAVRWVGITLAVLSYSSVLICVLKGKYRLALVASFVPLIGWIGAVRLARPSSWWARRRYSADDLARAERRAQEFDAHLYPWFRRLSDLIAGSPSPSVSAAHGAVAGGQTSGGNGPATRTTGGMHRK